MKQRIKGNTHSPNLYAGKELLPLQDFIAWATLDTSLERLYNYWRACNYNILYTPSVDRIDSSKGYILSNIRWVTHEQNSRMGGRSRHLRKYEVTHTEEYEYGF